MKTADNREPGRRRGEAASRRRRAALSRARHGFDDASRGTRLQKVLAEAGVASRRACETLIEQGLVSVNGKVIDTLPAWVDPACDRITVDGRVVAQPERHIYLMLFKPRGVVTTNNDPEGRRRAIDLIDHPSGARLYPVGPLGINSSGLLLLTNDGELANRLTHPRYEMNQVYEVTVGGALDAAAVKNLAQSILLNDRDKTTAGAAAAPRLSLLKREGDKTALRMELRQGHNREIRQLMADAGHRVKKLRRIQMGPLQLKGLSIGRWRELTREELATLRRAAPGDRRPPKTPPAQASPSPRSPDHRSTPRRSRR